MAVLVAVLSHCYETGSSMELGKRDDLDTPIGGLTGFQEGRQANGRLGRKGGGQTEHGKTQRIDPSVPP